MLDNNDVLLRIMEFLGPRHTCLGLGASCRAFRRLSRSNSLWVAFWKTRCLYPHEERCSGDDHAVHKAALVFRHAIHDMELGDKICAPRVQPQNGGKRGEPPSESGEDLALLCSAYIQQHCMMKLAQLRLDPFGRRLGTEDVRRSNLKRPSCTQTWPGQLSDVVGDNLPGERHYLGYRVTCANPAEAWCDHPACDRARCGPGGCLRCYRFAPRDYGASVSRRPFRECSERSYDFVAFVKCSFCCVSFCNQHVESWHKCDECQLSSCPDCASQVFSYFPDVERCKVVTAGKECGRTVCTECSWLVGKKKRVVTDNIPGGDVNQGRQAEIITAKRGAAKREPQAWEEVEMCCSKCVRHVEFRLRELAQVQDAFGLWGIMP